MNSEGEIWTNMLEEEEEDPHVIPLLAPLLFSSCRIFGLWMELLPSV